MNKERLIVGAIAVVVLGAVLLALREIVGVAGGIVFGALVALYSNLVIEELKRGTQEDDLTRAIGHELAHRVARCCFDFEHPWHFYLTLPQTMTAFRLRKFMPDDPLIFRSAGAQIVLLRSKAPGLTIHFYEFLASWQRDIRNTAEEFQGGKDVDANQVRFLARRIRQTLEPGLAALEEMAKHEPSIDQIAADYIAAGDKLFPNYHPNADKPVRERIKLILALTAQADGRAAGEMPIAAG